MCCVPGSSKAPAHQLDPDGKRKIIEPKAYDGIRRKIRKLQDTATGSRVWGYVVAKMMKGGTGIVVHSTTTSLRTIQAPILYWYSATVPNCRRHNFLPNTSRDLIVCFVGLSDVDPAMSQIAEPMKISERLNECRDLEIPGCRDWKDGNFDLAALFLDCTRTARCVYGISMERVSLSRIYLAVEFIPEHIAQSSQRSDAPLATSPWRLVQGDRTNCLNRENKHAHCRPCCVGCGRWSCD